MPFRDQLQGLLKSEREQAGFILKNGEIVEVENVCHDPENGFDVRPRDILRYASEAQATWHTHPNGKANLSENDYETFSNWPELDHYIVAPGEVACYVVRNGKVMIA